MINRVLLTGRLTKDVELKYTPNGVAVATFTLAVNRNFTNANGEREADFFNIVVWRRQAENAANFLSKGSLAGVDGRLQSRSYENQQGNRVFVTEVVAESVTFLEPKGSGQGGQSGQGGSSAGGRNGSRFNDPNGDPFANDGQPLNISDDDLPF